MAVCRCCSSTRIEKILDLGQQPWGNHFLPIGQETEAPRYPLELFLCANCSMVQIGYTIPKENMFVHHHYVSGTTRSLREHFDRIAGAITKRVRFSKSDYVLDIGGNDGTFLACLKARNINVLNVDSGVQQAEISRNNGIPCLNKFFNLDTAREILSQHGPAKVIHGSGIFFHLEELHSAFAGVSEILAPQGYVVAEFIYLPDMIKQCAFDQIYHEHLVYYTLTTFGRLLAQHDMKIVDGERMAIHGGSCLAWIMHAGAKQSRSDNLNALVAEEKATGMEALPVYIDFARRVEALRDKLVNMVRSLRAEGKRIYALGAPVKGSTIVNYCGFTHEDLECAVEINPLKVGTYLPGTHIPVRHQDDVVPPDVYLMLAWNFKDEILTKMNNFRAKGGRILIPVPEPTLI